MKVQILYFRDCPHYRPAVDLVRRTANRLGVEIDLELVEIDTPGKATSNRFLGSPTVRINGVDIDPAACDRADYGLSCRRYGSSGVPPPEMIAAAIKGGNGDRDGRG